MGIYVYMHVYVCTSPRGYKRKTWTPTALCRTLSIAQKDMREEQHTPLTYVRVLASVIRTYLSPSSSNLIYSSPPSFVQYIILIYKEGVNAETENRKHQVEDNGKISNKENETNMTSHFVRIWYAFQVARHGHVHRTSTPQAFFLSLFVWCMVWITTVLVSRPVIIRHMRYINIIRDSLPALFPKPFMSPSKGEAISRLDIERHSSKYRA